MKGDAVIQRAICKICGNKIQLQRRRKGNGIWVHIGYYKGERHTAVPMKNI